MTIKGLIGQPIQKIFYIRGSFILFMTHVGFGTYPLFGYEIWLIRFKEETYILILKWVF